MGRASQPLFSSSCIPNHHVFRPVADVPIDLAAPRAAAPPAHGVQGARGLPEVGSGLREGPEPRVVFDVLLVLNASPDGGSDGLSHRLQVRSAHLQRFSQPSSPASQTARRVSIWRRLIF